MESETKAGNSDKLKDTHVRNEAENKLTASTKSAISLMARWFPALKQVENPWEAKSGTWYITTSSYPKILPKVRAALAKIESSRMK